jgi:hypothetical protein
MYLNLRRQPGYRPVSSKVGDHLRILLGVVVHSFLFLKRRCSEIDGGDIHQSAGCWLPRISNTRMIYSFTMTHTVTSFRQAGTVSYIRTD